MGNIRLHIGLREPVQAPSDMWLTALLISLPESQRNVVIQNLAKVKAGNIKVLAAVPVPSGTIILPH